MKSQIRQIIFIGSTLVATTLVQASPLKAHEKKFHGAKKTSEPKTEVIVTPEAKTQPESSNSSQMLNMKNPETSVKPSSTPMKMHAEKKGINSVNSSTINNSSLIPQPGEMVFSLLLLGTFLLYYTKRRMYR